MKHIVRTLVRAFADKMIKQVSAAWCYNDPTEQVIIRPFGKGSYTDEQLVGVQSRGMAGYFSWEVPI